MALPAAVSIWAGWVGLGGMAGFGPVHLLPGIAPHFVVDTSITLPVGLEAYAAFALGAWLRPGVPDAARRFAKWSAIGALALGMAGQAAYHLLAAFRITRAPVFVIVLVACIPIAVIGFGAALAHLIRSGGEESTEQPARHELATFAAPLVSALAARISPVRDTAQVSAQGTDEGTPQGTIESTGQDTAQGSPEGTPEVTPQVTPAALTQGTTQGTARASKGTQPDRSEWPSARDMDDAELLKRTRSAVRQWERTHQPGEKLPASHLGDILKLRIGRDRSTKLLAEVYKPHLVKSVAGE
jgi:hypothetical protein